MRRIWALLTAAMLLTAVAAGPVSAAPTFHGGWTSATFPAGCIVPAHPVDGNWNVALLADGRAAVQYTTFEFGGHWASSGGAKLGDLWQQLSVGAGQEFKVSTTDPFGDVFTMTLFDDGTLTMVIAPFGPCAWGRADGFLIH